MKYLLPIILLTAGCALAHEAPPQVTPCPYTAQLKADGFANACVEWASCGACDECLSYDDPICSTEWWSAVRAILADSCELGEPAR